MTDISYELIKLDVDGKYIILSRGISQEMALNIETTLQSFLHSPDKQFLVLNGDVVKILEVDRDADK